MTLELPHGGLGTMVVPEDAAPHVISEQVLREMRGQRVSDPDGERRRGDQGGRVVIRHAVPLTSGDQRRTLG